jgi:uncharacterized membrane protein YkvA (DUF1232 family)
MLTALQNHLRALAAESNGRLKREIEARWGDKVTEEQVQKIKEFIFLMPPALKVLSKYWSEKSTPHKAKHLAGLIITYVYHPHDLISDNEHGLFGYIDDAYLTVSSFIRISDMYLHDWDEKSELERDLAVRAKELIEVPRLLIPKEAKELDEMIENWQKGNVEDIFNHLSKP